MRTINEPAGPDAPSTQQSSSDPAQTPRPLSTQRHLYVREIVVGVIVMVLGSCLVWALGIGTAGPQTLPPASVPDERAKNKESMFTQENYARIQVGLTAWELEDILGPPNLRHPVDLDAGLQQLYNLAETDDESISPHERDAAATLTEYEEMVWGSERFVQHMQQHMAVLLKNGKVIARRQWAVE